MSLVVGNNVSKSYDEPRYVLRNVSFRISNGDRIGLVGANGEGKTTLLKLIGGLESLTTGKIERKRKLRIGFLPQDPPAGEETTLWGSMLGVFDEVRELEDELSRVSERLGEVPDDQETLSRYGRLQGEFESRGGYTYENRIKTVLTGLGFEISQYHTPLAHLSGGERTRGLLGRLLLEHRDLLLLDEPTNHLDIENMEWLERWLQSQQVAMVVVSHDRHFLDRTTDRIWETCFGTLETYRYGYNDYLQQREIRYTERLRKWEQQQEYIRRTEEFIRRHIAGQRSREARGRRTRLERFFETEAIEPPRQRRGIGMRFRPGARGGDLVLAARDLTIGYHAGNPLLEVGDLEVRRGWRVATIGPNGAGKTTLLRTLIGMMEPLTGQVRRGANIHVGYLSQTHEDLRPDMTVLDALRDTGPSLTDEQARTLLGGFAFSADDVYKRIHELSGGERSRVILAKLTVRGSNLLVLDEPTNHLDIPSQEIFQEVLQEFPGTILFVTHDRYLVEALATHVWFFDGRSLHKQRGRWEDFVRWRSRREAPAAATQVSSKTADRARPLRRASESYEQARRRKRQREWVKRRLRELEEVIHRSEGQLKELTDEITRAGETGNMDKVREYGRQYKQTDEQLKRAWEQWEQLTESLET